MKSIRKFFFTFIVFVILFSFQGVAHAATLSLSPSSGTFSVGSTFDVSIFLNTNGKSVNALSVALSFPPDMLQVVSPSLGQSVIGVWTAAPKFDNAGGKLEFQGGIPGGITASNALVSTITFRVKSVGTAILKFLDGSKTLLNDGLGTNALSQSENAIFQLKLPPPAGPELASDTNPDQSGWYKNTTVSFRFLSGTAGVQGYSYTLSDDPTTIPDNINLGKQDTVTYTDLSNGIHFFHVKSLRDGVWGGTTHYSIKIDSLPPASFTINISPASYTSSRTPIIQFNTTDSFSGIDHYEMKVIPLSTQKGDTLFTEVVSPYISPPLVPGDYDVIVRAYDKAHNYREQTQRLVVATGVFSIIDPDGLRFGTVVISWVWVWCILGFGVLLASYVGYRIKIWHRSIYLFHKGKKKPESVEQKLEELKRYRAKYGRKALAALFVVFSLFASHKTFAESTTAIAPPVINSLSENITNREIFYIGGKTDSPNETVIVYIQNLDTGATLTETTQSDADGNWFYRHGGFLSAADYRLWVQGRIADYLSPPGPQRDMIVNRTAIQFGSNRLNYDVIYLFIIIILVGVILGLGIFSGYHYYHGRKKRAIVSKHIAEAEESIRRGFALLKRDIEDELALVKISRASEPHAAEHKEKEERILADLAAVQKHIGKDIWEIEESEKHA